MYYDVPHYVGFVQEVFRVARTDPRCGTQYYAESVVRITSDFNSDHCRVAILPDAVEQFAPIVRMLGGVPVPLSH